MIRVIIGFLIRIFPRRFREAFGADMIATFEDRWREKGGVRLAVRTIFDLAVSGVAQRMAEPSMPVRKGDSPMNLLLQDFRFALRSLSKSPAFSLVALATLALGIGVNTAMFSVANAVLWRSLPFQDPERIVWVGEVDRKNADVVWGTSYQNARDWQQRAHSFEKLAPVMRADRILRQTGDPVRVSGLAVTPEFFDVLGVQPAIGRAFAAADEQHGAAPVMVLSDAMWRKRFGADPAVMGRSIRLDDTAFTVIGIMPERFDYKQAEFWLAMEQVLPAYFRTHRSVWVLEAIARLRPGQTTRTAEQEMTAIVAQIRRDHPETVRDLVMRVSTLRSEIGRDLRPALVILLGAVAVVLLIACANLAGLMSVRAAARGREMAIRSALGAGRAGLMRQLLTECFTLAIAGAAAGIGLAMLVTRGLPLLTKDARLLQVAIDVRVLLFAVAAAIGTTLLFGLAPAIRAARADAADALKSGSRGSAGPKRALSRQALVVIQVAMCLMLLTGAGLLLRSFRRVLDVNPGFRADHLLSMRISMPPSYTRVAPALQAYAQFVAAIKALPGVADATMVNSLPISGGEGSGNITIEGNPAADLGAASFRRSMPGYFQTMGIPLARGRDFNDADDAQHDPVVIINEAMARRFWPDADPMGRRIKIGPRDSGNWMTIVGVAKDVRNIGLDTAAGFATYNPIAQQPRLQMEVAIRTAGDPQWIAASAQRELRRIEPALLIDKVQTMSQRISDSVAPRRLNLMLFGLFSGLALVLASVGLYGVVAYAAAQRTQEFGIRMALGARPGDVVRLVLGQGLRLALAGVAIGTAASLALARLLTKLLYGVDPTDPLTMISVAVLLAAVALAACWLPARRVTRIAPTEALRIE